MPLAKVKLTNFTAFRQLEVEFSPGINALVGENGTGKTHLLKVCYAASALAKSGDSFADKLLRVFLPSDGDAGRLVKASAGNALGSVEVFRPSCSVAVAFSKDVETVVSDAESGFREGQSSPLPSVYIPANELLATAPGFLPRYAAGEVPGAEVAADILRRAYLPPWPAAPEDCRQPLLTALEKAMGGPVAVKGEEFFLEGKHSRLEFSLLAAGIRKLALLWLLIRNGSLSEGSVLFWDEPETNLNPKLYGVLIQTLLELQRAGVQIFLATHDYVILKELDLRLKDTDQVAYHVLYRDETEEIACNTTGHYLGIRPNAIMDTFTDLYDREIDRSLGGMKR